VFQPGSGNDGTRVEIERAWLHNGELVLKFGGVDTRNDAEALRGAELRIPAEERPPAPEGEYYFSDLIGCRVERTDGEFVGEVAAWHDYGAAPLLEVRKGGREFLVPFTEAYYRTVDVKGKRIVMELPEGLEDLDAR
jgi:16S rRNA processing protein RimM